MATRKKRMLTPAEALASDEFAKALARVKLKEGRTQEQVGTLVGVSTGQVWQWANRRLPIPADKAQAVALAVEEIDPTKLSVAFRELTREGVRTPALIVNQLENDVDALRYALIALAGVFAAHRPLEAGEVAQQIQAQAPQRFLASGWLADFLDSMQKLSTAQPARRRGASAR